jgi:hypothetical protein
MADSTEVSLGLDTPEMDALISYSQALKKLVRERRLTAEAVQEAVPGLVELSDELYVAYDALRSAREELTNDSDNLADDVIIKLRLCDAELKKYMAVAKTIGH